MRDPHRPSGRKRLRALASLIPRGSRVADIGTDHGLLPRHLVLTGTASWCVASDLAGQVHGGPPGPRNAPLADRLEFRSADGLSALRPGDVVDVVVLAGMGAARIVRILAASRGQGLGFRRLVLQPQSEPALLRRWLLEQGWQIVEERLVEERGRFYVLLAAERSEAAAMPRHPSLSESDLLEAGPCLVRSADPAVRRFWLDRTAVYGAALGRARSEAARARVRGKRDLAQRILSALP